MPRRISEKSGRSDKVHVFARDFVGTAGPFEWALASRGQTAHAPVSLPATHPGLTPRPHARPHTPATRRGDGASAPGRRPSQSGNWGALCTCGRSGAAALCRPARRWGMALSEQFQQHSVLSPSPFAVHSEPQRWWERACERGDAVRLVRGRYVLAPEWKAASPWQRRRCLIQAWHEAHPAAPFRGETALFLRGIPTLGSPAVLHTSGGASSRCRRTQHRVICAGRVLATFTVHRRHLSSVPEEIGDWRLETVAEAVAAVAAEPVADQRAAIVALDGSLRFLNAFVLGERAQSAASRRVIAQAISRRSSRAAPERAAGRLMNASALSESAGESLVRAGIAMLGFSPPVEQPEIAVAGRLFRPDFLWPSLRLILEFDGELKYRGADEASVRRNEKERQQLLIQEGFAVHRITWAQADDLHRLRQILHAAGVPSAALSAI